MFAGVVVAAAGLRGRRQEKVFEALGSRQIELTQIQVQVYFTVVHSVLALPTLWMPSAH